MSKANQTQKIKAAINSYLDQGLSDKSDIYDRVVQDLDVPRPTVRRVAANMRDEMLDRVHELERGTAPRG